MTDKKQNEDNKRDERDGPVYSDDPERELELRLKKHPQDLDAKADVGSDESMDASDPISATQPGSDEPAPSSGYREK